MYGQVYGMQEEAVQLATVKRLTKLMVSWLFAFVCTRGSATGVRAPQTCI